MQHTQKTIIDITNCFEVSRSERKICVL